MRLHEYFTFWALAYIAACSLLGGRGRGRGRGLCDAAAVVLFLLFGNLALLALSALVWRRPFDTSFFVASAALHGVGLAALRRWPTRSAWTRSAWTRSAWTRSAWTRSAWTRSAWTRSAWAAPLRNLFLLWFAYLVVVGGPARVRGVYRRMPTRWSDLSLLT